MNNDDLGSQAARAAKWSMATQIISKLIGPATTMILARLLTPEAFGIVAIATMIISLADLFSDAGFQKYLVQHKFINKSEEHLNASVAFWTNLSLSLFFLVVIVVFCEQMAELSGASGYGNVLVVSSFSVPLTAIISVQTALYQKHLDFKTLFSSQLLNPLFETVHMVIMEAIRQNDLTLDRLSSKFRL